MGLFDRIKSVIRKLIPPKLPSEPAGAPPPEEDVPPAEVDIPEEMPPASIEREVGGYLDKAGMTHMIRMAAKQKTLLYMRYNNTWRHVEPYSFRPGKGGLLFYGHCLIHNDTHSFYIHKIQGLQLTEIPFSPRWFIEL